MLETFPLWNEYSAMSRIQPRAIDFTSGNLRHEIVMFSLPLFLGNLFQQLYTAADSLIVGNTLGPLALASVSSSGPLIFMMTGFFNGVATGAGVVIAKYIGARDKAKVRDAVNTDFCFGLVSGAALTVLGVVFTPSILSLMKTPEDIMEQSVTYFRIYSAGIIFSIMYNITMGIMNAEGDSAHPLEYLLISSAANVILDIFFIRVLHTGVGGAAFATVLSQALSFFLSLIRLSAGDAVCRLDLRKPGFSRPILREIIRYGLPSGIQNSVIAIANLVVQSNINTFSSVAVAASGAYSKIEGFAFIPITSFSMALTTLISQNLGAGNHERAKKGAAIGIAYCLVLSELIGLGVFVFAPFLISAFNSSSAVVSIGVRQCRIESLFYCLLALSHSIAGVMRGAGKAKVPMFVMLSIWCILRVTYITAALTFSHTIELVYMAYPLTWTLSSVIFVIYMKSSDWVHGLEGGSQLRRVSRKRSISSGS